MSNEDYIQKQNKRDAEYAQACAEAGIKPDMPSYECINARDNNEDILQEDVDLLAERNPQVTDIAETLDQHIDFVVEKHAATFLKIINPHGKAGVEDIVRPLVVGLIREVANDLKKPMNDEIAKNHSELLARIAGYLIYTTGERGNHMAKVHALLHSIPRFAIRAGFPSMRTSAKICGVSPEWMRRKRDECCVLLGVEPPDTGCKTPEAKEKYRKNAQTNHWRHQTYKANSI